MRFYQAFRAGLCTQIPSSNMLNTMRHVEDEGLTWIEEPTLAHNYQGHAHIAREIRTPIQCGEN
jgi:mandelate racemase